MMKAGMQLITEAVNCTTLMMYRGCMGLGDRVEAIFCCYFLESALKFSLISLSI